MAGAEQLPRLVANSIPKSGTHLLVSLLEAFAFRQSEAHLSAGLVDLNTSRNPLKQLEKWICRRGAPGYEVSVDSAALTASGRCLGRALARVGPGQYVESHVPYSRALSELIRDRGLKMLFIYRDPRDVALSYVNHMLRDRHYPPARYFQADDDANSQVQRVLDGLTYGRGGVLAPLVERYRRCLGWLDAPGVLVLRFEDLIGSNGGGDDARQREAVARVVDYLGLDLSVADCARVAEQVFFTGAETFHKGRIGSWSEVFDAQTRKRFATEMGEVLSMLGYT
jgi:hypothetical protein